MNLSRICRAILSTIGDHDTHRVLKPVTPTVLRLQLSARNIDYEQSQLFSKVEVYPQRVDEFLRLAVQCLICCYYCVFI